MRSIILLQEKRASTDARNFQLKHKQFFRFCVMHEHWAWVNPGCDLRQSLPRPVWKKWHSWAGNAARLFNTKRKYILGKRWPPSDQIDTCDQMEAGDLTASIEYSSEAEIWRIGDKGTLKPSPKPIGTHLCHFCKLTPTWYYDAPVITMSAKIAPPPQKNLESAPSIEVK